MPLYDYRCRACSNVSEVRHGFRETYDGTCPACGSTELARVFNPAGIVFKGSGFYVTDSRKPAASESGSSKGSSGSESAAAPSGSDSSSSASAPSSSAPAKKNEASAA